MNKMEKVKEKSDCNLSNVSILLNDAFCEENERVKENYACLQNNEKVNSIVDVSIIIAGVSEKCSRSYNEMLKKL